MHDFRLPSLITAMADRPELWAMGHNQDQESLDLGLGWLYYGLARSLKPSLVVVIGSWRGFVPMVLAQALQDAGQGGELLFIDPSLVDGQWRAGVDEYFAEFGIHCIRHYCETSQQFLAANRIAPGSIDLLFVDGYHTEEQCRLEYEGFAPLLSERAMSLFHDSSSRMISGLYGAGNEYEHTVWRYLDALRVGGDVDILNLEVAQGVAIVRKRQS